jgi:hypothetical protein
VVGVGLGLVMQVIVLAIQNAVDMTDIGAATASAQFFRMTGGTIGLAVFGAVLNNRLLAGMQRRLGTVEELPEGVDAQTLMNDPDAATQLPSQLQGVFADELSAAITLVFALALPSVVLAFVAALRLRELPLQDRLSPPQAPAPRPISSENTPDGEHVIAPDGVDGSDNGHGGPAHNGNGARGGPARDDGSQGRQARQRRKAARRRAR